MQSRTENITVSAICLSLAMVLPFITGQIPQIGAMLAPMHLPIIICGLLCSPMYGLIIGLLSPLLRFVIFGMPPLFPIGIAMSFELATYGLVASLLYKKYGIYKSLITTMILGRMIWGITMAGIAGFSDISFGLNAFFTVAFINSFPGIMIQIVFIPVIIKAIKRRNNLSENKRIYWN